MGKRVGELGQDGEGDSGGGGRDVIKGERHGKGRERK